MGHVNAAHPSAVATRTGAGDGISRALRTVGLGVLCDLGLVDPGTVLRFPLRCISGTLVLAVVLRSLRFGKVPWHCFLLVEVVPPWFSLVNLCALRG